MAEQPQTMDELLHSLMETARTVQNPVVPTIATREYAELNSAQRTIADQMLAQAQFTAMALHAAQPGVTIMVRQTDHYYRNHDDGTARRLAGLVETIGSRMR